MAKTEEKKDINLGHGVGRRKTSVARAYLRKGNGKITVNRKDVSEYFVENVNAAIVSSPFAVTGTTGKYDMVINVMGGGISSQAQACRHAVSRALVSADEKYRKALHDAGFMTRDSRMVERKKYGQRGARKRFQFSKR